MHTHPAVIVEKAGAFLALSDWADYKHDVRCTLCLIVACFSLIVAIGNISSVAKCLLAICVSQSIISCAQNM